MAVVDPPEILAYRLNLAANTDSARLTPASNSWEVHSIVGSGKFTVYRKDDPDKDGIIEVSVPIAQRVSAGEIMGLKLEVGPYQGLVIHNDESSSPIDVEIIGIVIR